MPSAVRDWRYEGHDTQPLLLIVIKWGNQNHTLLQTGDLDAECEPEASTEIQEDTGGTLIRQRQEKTPEECQDERGGK